MLRIRDSQKIALADALMTTWLRDELARLFPKECLAMGPAGLAGFIHSGLARAKKHGFRRDDSLQYLAMEICFGAGFLDASENEWARTALDSAPTGRMQSLYRAAVFHLAKLAEKEQRQAVATREDGAPQADQQESLPADTPLSVPPESVGEPSHG